MLNITGQDQHFAARHIGCDHLKLVSIFRIVSLFFNDQIAEGIYIFLIEQPCIQSVKKSPS